MKAVIVTGGRDYADHVMVQEILDFINPDLVIHGGASGADSLCAEWAVEKEKYCSVFNADWDKHGKAAGPIRNREMLKAHPEAVVIAFPGGRGTADCVKAAYEQNRIILLVR